MMDKELREPGFFAKDTHHAFNGEPYNCTVVNSRGARYTYSLTIQCSFTEEMLCLKNANHGLFAPPGDDGDLYLACLNVKNVRRRILLRENNFAAAVFRNPMTRTGRGQKYIRIKVDG